MAMVTNTTKRTLRQGVLVQLALALAAILGLTATAGAQPLSDLEAYDMTAFSTLENYYMMNGCFLDDDQLLREAHKIAHIPTYIVNGRFDAICPPKTALDLAQRLERVEVEIVPDAAHSHREPSNAAALLRGVTWVADQIDN